MSTPTKGSSTPSAKSMSKSAKQSKIITLHLTSKTLAKFPSDSKPKHSIEPPTVVPPESESADNKSTEDNGTPLPAGTPTAADDKSLAPPEGGKKKGLGGPKTGTKRSSLTPADAKGKGRPGPKKKPRLADGSIDRTKNDGKKDITFAVPALPTTGHKLGPKANNGPINAGLRALDRSGKPCRKWARKGFELKSFTGIEWGIGSWTAPQRDSSTFSGDVKSDSSSPGEVKQTMESSAIPSERSSNDAAAIQPNGVDSSPAPIPA